MKARLFAVAVVAPTMLVAAAFTGKDSMALGTNAGRDGNSDRTVLIGSGAGAYMSGGDSNIVVGAAAALGSWGVKSSALIGHYAGRTASNLKGAVGIGDLALNNASDMSNTVAIGQRAMEGMWGANNAVLVGGGLPAFLRNEPYGIVNEYGNSPGGDELCDWTDINHQIVVRAHKYDTERGEHVGEFYIKPNLETSPENAPIYYKGGKLSLNADVAPEGLVFYDYTGTYAIASEGNYVQRDAYFSTAVYDVSITGRVSRLNPPDGIFTAENSFLSCSFSDGHWHMTGGYGRGYTLTGRIDGYPLPLDEVQEGDSEYEFPIPQSYIRDLDDDGWEHTNIYVRISKDTNGVATVKLGTSASWTFVTVTNLTGVVSPDICEVRLGNKINHNRHGEDAVATAKSAAEYTDSSGFRTKESKMLEYTFDLYLAPYGNDMYDGRSSDFPKRTIAGCYAAATTNATVCVFPGDYETISNEKTTSGSLFYPSYNLTFVAVGGKDRTSITGKYTSDGIAQNGYYHTLAFNNGPQRFIGFTIRRLSGWSKSESQAASSNNSPCMSCVVLEDCTVEDCDVCFWLSYGAFNTCAFADTVFRNISLDNYGTGNPPNVFIQCEFENCRVEVDSLENHIDNRHIRFFNTCEARSSLYSLPPVLDTEYASRSCTFWDCTFVWDYNPAYRQRVTPGSCSNCYFCVGTSYSSEDGECNVFASSWTNTLLNEDFVPRSIECPAVRTGGQMDAGWRQSGLGELKNVAYNDVVTVTNWNFTTELLPGKTLFRTEKTDSLAVWHYVGPEDGGGDPASTNDVTVAYAGDADSGEWTMTWINLTSDAGGPVAATNTAVLAGSAGWLGNPRLDFGGGYVFDRSGDASYTTRYGVVHENDFRSLSQAALESALGGCTFQLENGTFNVYTNGVKAGTLTFTPAVE